eukprot:4636113-Pyramimonas_sp.AAC.1
MAINGGPVVDAAGRGRGRCGGEAHEVAVARGVAGHSVEAKLSTVKVEIKAVLEQLEDARSEFAAACERACK